MKVLDVHAFETGMDETRQKVTTLSSQLKQAEESVNQLISLSDAFKGEGPQAILTFFEQYHKPLLNTYHTFCEDYQLTIEQMRHALFGFEPDPNGFIRQSFLENELKQGLIHARTTTIELTNEANAIMQTVSDIVSLPPLREDSVVRACDEAIRYKQDTIEKLVQFDGQQTKALAPVESLLQSITEKIQFMEDIFIQGDTSVHVKTTAVEGLSCERPETEIKEKKAWYEVVGNVIIGAIEGIVKAVVDIFKGLFDLLKSLFTDPIGFFKGIGSAIFNPVDTFNQLWGVVEAAWERDVVNGDARSRASFFSYTVVSVVGLKGIDKLGKAGKLGNAASKADNNIPYNAFRTDKLKELIKTNIYTNMQQKAKQTADLLKSNFGKEAINKTIQAAKNSEIITKARNTLNPNNMKAAWKKIYEDVVKAPIAKTQDWMQAAKSMTNVKPVTPKVEKQSNVFVKSWNSFKGIGKDFYNGLGQRADKALDSPYDFVNYLSVGILDGVYSGAKSRESQKFNSTEDFLDYATFGFSGMLKGAISPEEQFSKEHWLNSFGVVTSVFGLRGVTKNTGNLPSSSSSSATQNSGTKGTVNSKYTYNMVENPGPLAEINQGAASTFRSGMYNVTKLESDTILYRSGKAGGGKNALGQYFTREPGTKIEGRIDSAVKAQWINPKTGVLTGSSPLETVYGIKIPKGTTIYEGPAGYQGGYYLGGGNQIFVPEPWKINGVEVISSTPIK